MAKFLPQERAAAKAAGETIYFTGRPCKRNHVAYRCTSSGQCVECAKTFQKEVTRKKYEQNPLVYKQKYAANADLYKKRAAKYRLNNPEAVVVASKKWAQKNKHKKAFYERKRQASKLQRTPNWLTQDHLDQIKQYYFVANDLTKKTNIKFQVDHIVPLQGEQVSGLHVPWNLIVITQEENVRKFNKLVDFPWQTTGSGVLIGESALPWNLKKETQNGKLANH